MAEEPAPRLALQVRAVSLVDLADAPTPTPFQHPAWHATWLRHFEPACEPVFLLCEDVPRSHGEAAPSPGLPVGWAAFDIDAGGARELGDPNVRDYGGPVAVPGREADVAGAVFDWLEEDFARYATFWGLDGDGAMLPALREAAATHGWRLTETEEAVCPGRDLPPTWDDFLAGLPKHDRHELRRKLRRLGEEGEVAFTSATEGPALAAALETLLAQMRQSRADKAEFLAPAMEAFFRDLAATFGQLGIARIGLLNVNGAPVGSTFTFELGGVTYLYNSGYDPAAGHAAGLLAKAHTIRHAIERGQRRFDLLRGSEDYKRHLGGIPRRVVTLRAER